MKNVKAPGTSGSAETGGWSADIENDIEADLDDDREDDFNNEVENENDVDLRRVARARQNLSLAPHESPSALASQRALRATPCRALPRLEVTGGRDMELGKTPSIGRT